MKQEYGLSSSNKKFTFKLFFLIYFIAVTVLALHMTAQFLGQYFPKESVSLFGVSFYPFWKTPYWYYLAYNYSAGDEAVRVFYLWFMPPNFLMLLYGMYCVFPKGQ